MGFASLHLQPGPKQPVFYLFIPNPNHTQRRSHYWAGHLGENRPTIFLGHFPPFQKPLPYSRQRGTISSVADASPCTNPRLRPRRCRASVASWYSAWLMLRPIPGVSAAL